MLSAELSDSLIALSLSYRLWGSSLHISTSDVLLVVRSRVPLIYTYSSGGSRGELGALTPPGFFLACQYMKIPAALDPYCRLQIHFDSG